MSVYTQYLWPISPTQCFYGPRFPSLPSGATISTLVISTLSFLMLLRFPLPRFSRPAGTRMLLLRDSGDAPPKS